MLNFFRKGPVIVPRLLPSENGFFLTVVRKTVDAYFFGVLWIWSGCSDLPKFVTLQ